MSPHPRFAVVGHPNKGKSSIVSTLAHDDSVLIGDLPGTTTRCRSFPLKVDGEVLYTLVDTPGFQRARAAWAWLQSHASSADRHPEAVQAFLDAHADRARFDEEVELLTPVMDGAGILYVVDGSVPYGAEYEAEMEILRWTGRPRLALINPIGEADHIDAWRTALGQYFSVVRVFDAVTADFEKRIELLRAFGQLEEDWRAPLQRAVDSLVDDRRGRREAAARAVADTLVEMLTVPAERTIGPDTDPEPVKTELAERYQRGLADLEQRARKAVERIYDHHTLERTEPVLAALAEQDLFSAESWRIFGLTRLQLAGLGALGGAAAGGAIDLAVGGASMLLGVVIGGGVGAAGALIAANKLVDVKLLEVPLGRKRLVAGPTRNRNFPYVVLGRARLHHALVAGRSHAQRGALTVGEQAESLLPDLTGQDRKRLEKVFGRLRSGRDVGVAARELQDAVGEIFERDTVIRPA